MRRLQSGVAVCLSLLLLITVIFPVYADNIQEQQRKLQDINQQIDRQRSSVNQARQKEKTVVGQI